MKDLQVTFYDIISILLPASLVLAILHFQTGLIHSNLLVRIVNNSLGVTATAGTSPATVALPAIAGFAIPFIVAYLLGHATNLVTKFIQDTPGLKRILFPRSYLAISHEDKIVFNRGTFPVVFNKEVGEKILHKLGDFYGIHFTQHDYVDNYLMATLSATGATKRDIFVAIASMMRNTAIIGLGFALFFAFDLINSFSSQIAVGNVQNDVLFLLVSIGSFYLFRYGFLKYQGFAEHLLFFSFLTAPKPLGLPDGIKYDAKKEPTQASKPASVTMTSHLDDINTPM
jgi:hypothetical protein